MTDINQKLLTGERACFKAENMTITQSSNLRMANHR